MTKSKPAGTVITIDIGSGSCRALAWDILGNTLAICQEEWEYEISEHPGGLDFNTEQGWSQISECVRGIFAEGIDPKTVRGVTSTSMREGFVLFDENDKEIWAIPNVDARAQKEAEELLAAGHGRTFYEQSGDWTSLAASARLLWIKKHEPEIWKNAKRMSMLSDWVLQRLTGQFVSDPTVGSSSALFDLKDRQWSKHITDTLGVSHLMPTVVESGTKIGTVSKEASEATGLPMGTPVFAGGADTQMGLLGASVTKPGQLGIVGGTYWLTAGIVDQPLLDPKMELRTLCHAIPGEWMVEGCGFAHGLSTRWVRDQLLRTSDPEISIDEGYLILDRLAADVPPGSNGVSYFSSNVMDTKTWKHPSPTITGVNPLSDKPTGLGEIFRAVLESTCYVARGHVEMIEEAVDAKYGHTIFLGGASYSPLWSQMLADILNIPVEVPDVKEVTCLGAALCAWTGLGEFNSLEEAASLTVKPARMHYPDLQQHQEYDRLYHAWRELISHELDAADKGLTEYMWVGAGANGTK